VPFFDTNNFDKQLSASCRRGADTIVVTFEAPSSVNAIPERLNIGAFAMLYEVIANKILYGPVKSYNTTVYYIKGSGMITKVVFARKLQQSQE